MLLMELKEAVNKRFSIRKYQTKAVPVSLVREIIELAKLAPSAGNLQSYKVVITREKLTNIDAPLNLVICAEPEKSASRYGERGRNLYAIQDATIFASYIQLALVDAGLASCWVGAFREEKLRSLLKIPNNIKPIAIVCVGYAIGEKVGRKRRPFEKIVLWQK